MENGQLRILAIGAHPDDCDCFIGGSAIKYSKLGHIVKFVSATNGCAGHYRYEESEVVRIRAEEVKQAAQLAGIEYEILDIKDGRLQADLATREIFIMLIRKFKPDMIFTHRTYDYHADHRNTGLLVQDSSYLVSVPSICPSTECLRYQPVILNPFDDFKKPIVFTADIVVDIDDAVDKKAQMMDCHKSQFYEWLPWVEGEIDKVPGTEKERFSWLREKMIVNDASVAQRYRKLLVDRYGGKRGSEIKYAEAFEISEYGAPLPPEKLSIYFPF